MFTFLAIVHVVVSVIMVTFILLQDPKGGGGALGMMGGGGSKSLFGSTGGNTFLINVTKWTAIIFAFTSIYLAALSAQKEKSVMDQFTQEAAEPVKNKGDSKQTTTEQEKTSVDQTPSDKESTTKSPDNQ